MLHSPSGERRIRGAGIGHQGTGAVARKGCNGLVEAADIERAGADKETVLLGLKAIGFDATKHTLIDDRVGKGCFESR